MAAAGALNGAEMLRAASEAAGIAPVAYKHDDLEYDLGLLSALDSHALDPAALGSEPSEAREAALLALATENAQLLVRRIFELPGHVEAEGPVVDLPERTTKLPRWKPAPEKKPLTRWEKFALEKGIKKKKKDRMVWDEEKGEWRPNWGYKRAKAGVEDEWAVEVKDGEDPTVDPWERARLEKKERVLKNQLNRVRNAGMEHKDKAAKLGLAEAPLTTVSGAMATTFALDGKAATGRSGGALVAPRAVAVAVPADAGGERKKAKKLGKGKAAAPEDGAAGAAALGPKALAAKARKAEREAAKAAARGPAPPVGIPQISSSEGAIDPIKGGTGGAVSAGSKRPRPSETKGIKTERLKVAQLSTASLGKFDRTLSGEPSKPKDPRHVKRTPNEVPVSSEKARQADILRRVLGGSGEGESAAPKSRASSAGPPPAKRRKLK